MGGVTGYIGSKVADGLGVTAVVDTHVKQAESWISNQLQQTTGMGEQKSDMLASAGTFGLMFGVGAMVGSTKDKLLEKAGQVAEKVKFYFTYTKYKPKTGQTYSGRGSGVGDPNNPYDVQRALERRDARHHKNAEGYGRAKLDKVSTNPDSIRGREQIQMDSFGGAQSTGGTSGNSINGIRKNHPKKDIFMQAGSTLE
ncbi:hypothetical protein [Candidatus Odyssella thessalonicensis]|uniref:hypothetical protein n=1 Tax=Candidatus Odyssella thessalonicensis TaxID=84647 RepID=UPI000225B239|nr:hypothetical protein [Candidatus Odyssella thessalonicensis]